MIISKTLLATALVALIGSGTSSVAVAHGPGGSSGSPNHEWNRGAMMGPGYGMRSGHGMMGPMMDHGMGPGMMAPGMMGPGMMGPGQGMGPGMMQPLRQDLTAADVEHMMGHRLAWGGNPNIKLGKVVEKDDDTIVAEIVTKDGSLVRSLEVNRHTGWTRPVQ